MVLHFYWHVVMPGILGYMDPWNAAWKVLASTLSHFFVSREVTELALYHRVGLVGRKDSKTPSSWVYNQGVIASWWEQGGFGNYSILKLRV